ncbi:MAG: LamG domain-containing protein [bacterium]|nr:LamG domain-containing protein [bacterium]
MAMEFNGGQYINCGNVLNLGSSDRTIVFWLRKNGILGHESIFAKEHNRVPYLGYAVAINPDGRAVCAITNAYPTAWRERCTASAVVDNAWHCIAFGYGSGEIHAYLDGAIDDGTVNGVVGAHNTDNAVNFEIGTRGSNDGFVPLYLLAGVLDDLRIYSRALSAAEIQTIHACNGHDGIVQGLVGRWLLNELSPGTAATDAGGIVDISGNGNHGTPYGGPVYRGSELSFGKRYL